jgi:hypothetical protein
MTDEIIPLRRPGGIPVSTQIKEESKYPTENIPLPTEGFFYVEGNPLASGVIELKQMTAREEDILANQDLIKKGTVVDKLIESLIVDKSVRVEDIFTQDKNAILIAVRRLAYGDGYPISVECSRCSTQNKLVIDLNSIKNKEVNWSGMTRGQNRISFKLPSCGKEITFKLLNQTDDNSIEQELKNLKKVSKESSSELTTRLKYIITSVDGNSDQGVIRKFIDTGLLAKDSLALRQHMKEVIPNIDLSFDFHCEKCETERRMDIPMGASFLWPDATT